MNWGGGGEGGSVHNFVDVTVVEQSSPVSTQPGVTVQFLRSGYLLKHILWSKDHIKRKIKIAC